MSEAEIHAFLDSLDDGEVITVVSERQNSFKDSPTRRTFTLTETGPAVVVRNYVDMAWTLVRDDSRVLALGLVQVSRMEVADRRECDDPHAEDDIATPDTSPAPTEARREATAQDFVDATWRAVGMDGPPPRLAPTEEDPS